MPFTYQMVDMDSQQLFETLNAARVASFNFMRAANETNDKLAETLLKDLAASIAKASSQLADMNRKIEHLRAQAAEKSTT